MSQEQQLQFSPITSPILYNDQDDEEEDVKHNKKSGNFNPNFYNPFEIKHRRRTSRGQFKILEKAFIANPKPNAKARQSLADSLSMSPRGVQVWFQNRRAKAKQHQDKSHDIVQGLQVTSTPIVLSSSGMVHSRSQSSSSSCTSSSKNESIHVMNAVHQVCHSDAASIVTTEDMMASHSPLLSTPPQQQQEMIKDDYSWWMGDVSGLIPSSQQTLLQHANDDTTAHEYHKSDPFTIQIHPFHAWNNYNIQFTNNHSFITSTPVQPKRQYQPYNRHIVDWLSSTNASYMNELNLHHENWSQTMVNHPKRTLYPEHQQIMRHPSQQDNSYYYSNVL